jgi:hypothetical protein
MHIGRKHCAEILAKTFRVEIMIAGYEYLMRMRLSRKPIEESDGILLSAYIAVITGMYEYIALGQFDLLMMIVRIRYGDDSGHILF